MQNKRLFSVATASRFEIVDKEYIIELKNKSENQNTKNSKEYWKNVFKLTGRMTETSKQI